MEVFSHENIVSHSNKERCSFAEDITVNGFELGSNVIGEMR